MHQQKAATRQIRSLLPSSGVHNGATNVVPPGRARQHQRLLALCWQADGRRGRSDGGLRSICNRSQRAADRFIFRDTEPARRSPLHLSGYRALLHAVGGDGRSRPGWRLRHFSGDDEARRHGRWAAMLLGIKVRVPAGAAGPHAISHLSSATMRGRYRFASAILSGG